MIMEMMSATSQLPPGFRFHPTDEELILHYLRNRAAAAPCPVPIIADVDIYKFDPWDLPCKAAYGDGEWYFFSPRDRKYPNGIRPNRAAGSGYWKATGIDKPIHHGATGESVGVKKALVFYKGRAPKGTKTNWIMHEYRLAAAAAAAYRPPVKFRNVSMRLDDWVLCRIYKKSGLLASPTVPPLADYDHLHYHHDESSGGLDDICGFTSSTRSVTTQQQQQLPKTPSFSDLLFDEYTLAHLLDAADHAPLAMHPSLNQLLAVGDSTHPELMIYSAASALGAPAGCAGKRKASLDAGIMGHHPPGKRLNGSCFDAPRPARGGLPATSPVLSGLNHQIDASSALETFLWT